MGYHALLDTHSLNLTSLERMKNIYKLLHIDDFSATLKYLQIANRIINAIEQGLLEKDELLPSNNELSFMTEKYSTLF